MSSKLLCGCRFEPAKYINMHVVPKDHFFKHFNPFMVGTQFAIFEMCQNY